MWTVRRAGPTKNSVDEYIASEKEDLESYKADLEEALEKLKDMIAYGTGILEYGECRK